MGNLSSVPISGETTNNNVKTENKKSENLLSKGIIYSAVTATFAATAVNGTNSIFNKIEGYIDKRNCNTWWAQRGKLAEEYRNNMTQENLEKFKEFTKTKNYDAMMNEMKNKYMPSLLKANKITKIITGVTAALLGVFVANNACKILFEN